MQDKIVIFREIMSVSLLKINNHLFDMVGKYCIGGFKISFIFLM